MTDVAGRAVQVPEQINRVVTLGSLPVLNSFVSTMGEGRTLINGLSGFGLSPQRKWRRSIETSLATSSPMSR